MCSFLIKKKVYLIDDGLKWTPLMLQFGLYFAPALLHFSTRGDMGIGTILFVSLLLYQIIDNNLMSFPHQPWKNEDRDVSSYKLTKSQLKSWRDVLRWTNVSMFLLFISAFVVFDPATSLYFLAVIVFSNTNVHHKEQMQPVSAYPTPPCLLYFRVVLLYLPAVVR